MLLAIVFRPLRIPLQWKGLMRRIYVLFLNLLDRACYVLGLKETGGSAAIWPRKVAKQTAAVLELMLSEGENIIVTDFGQSFDTKHPPKDYGLTTTIYYFPPEALFDHKFNFASDVWVLIGEGDELPRVDEGRMIEAVGTPLEEEVV
ncbi:hypothetical protein F5887DRAFT_1158760 [Amanita rubescens]|nr:hypothetical protein F5887DRAFT_1158760 [Amanita rubescens]